MASSAFVREKHLLTIGIVLLDHRYAALPLPGRVLQLMVTNLRNRPLTSTNIDSMRQSILSLYHSLITGSKDFPLIPFRGFLRSCEMATPFSHVEQEQRENTRPSPPMEGPAGMMAPPAGSSSAPPSLLFPVHPEQMELGALQVDHRNRIRRLEVGGRTVTRVISPVYDSDGSEKMNRWRVTDYGADRHIIMSVLCHFPKGSRRCLVTQGKKRKRRNDPVKETSSSSTITLPPPSKRLRL
ncbi:uncharacterized protein LOC108897880 [Lates calcarifer]|uniref:Uncharacterized protein LOC108897880 n=1 Tax=Lates calcarifer TaxID=8187 RepID=A0AAJ7QDC6_LATCA|nr:uncharacterized protein LOC108897880 [Lates calcarifer]